MLVHPGPGNRDKSPAPLRSSYWDFCRYHHSIPFVGIGFAPAAHSHGGVVEHLSSPMIQRDRNGGAGSFGGPDRHRMMRPTCWRGRRAAVSDSQRPPFYRPHRGPLPGSAVGQPLVGPHVVTIRLNRPRWRTRRCPGQEAGRGRPLREPPTSSWCHGAAHGARVGSARMMAYPTW